MLNYIDQRVQRGHEFRFVPTRTRRLAQRHADAQPLSIPLTCILHCRVQYTPPNNRIGATRNTCIHAFICTALLSENNANSQSLVLSLDLADNEIGDAGVIALAEALEGNVRAIIICIIYACACVCVCVCVTVELTM